MVKEGIKKSLGRQKIEIKKIRNNMARQVCFSKRRNGLFTKASEISILCNAEVAAIVFSPAGKAFAFGHPSVEAVTRRFLDGKPSKVAKESSASSPVAAVIHRDLNGKLMDLGVMVEWERQRRTMLEKELKRCNEEINMLGLMEYEGRLLEFKGEMGKWVEEWVTYWNEYGVVSGSNMGHVGSVTHQFMPMKNDLVISEQVVTENTVKNELMTDSNGHFPAYEKFGGEGGRGLGFGSPFFGGFQ